MAGEDNQTRPRLLVIAGPTGVGKTEIGAQVAQKIGGEIISADSAAVFRGLDVGTAKPPLALRQVVVHHGLDLVDATARYSVADFQTMAKAAIEDIVQRGRVPIVVGGTGLWIRALVRDYQLPPEGEPSPMRQLLHQFGMQDGYRSLRRQLRVVDPGSASAIAINDHRRLVRALEVFITTGRPLSRSVATPSPYHCVYWVLSRAVAELQQRIGARTAAMMRDGLVAEVQSLLSQGVPPRSQSLSAIGYRETVDWIYGLLTASERDALITRHTRQLAKRQLTWFRGEKEARWLDLSAWPIPRAVDKIVESVR